MIDTKQSSQSWSREKDLSLHRGFRWPELSPVRRTSYPMSMIILWRMGVMSVPLNLDDVANGVAKPWSFVVVTVMVVTMSPRRWRPMHYWRGSSANCNNNETAHNCCDPVVISRLARRPFYSHSLTRCHRHFSGNKKFSWHIRAIFTKIYNVYRAP